MDTYDTYRQWSHTDSDRIGNMSLGGWCFSKISHIKFGFPKACIETIPIMGHTDYSTYSIAVGVGGGGGGGQRISRFVWLFQIGFGAIWINFSL